MFVPHVGETFPTSGAHEGHEARIVAVDAHGAHSWDDPETVALAPTVTVLCRCGALWREDLVEALAA